MKRTKIALLTSLSIVGVAALIFASQFSNNSVFGFWALKQGTPQTYHLALDAKNAPNSYGDGVSVVANAERRTTIVLNYSSASYKEGYHASLAQGGYIENTTGFSGANKVYLNGLGVVKVTYGQEQDDLYLDKEVTLNGEETYFELPARCNYFKLEAVAATDLEEFGVDYSCVPESPKYLVKINHLGTNNSVLGDPEYHFVEKSEANTILTLNPENIDGYVLDKDLIKTPVVGHKELNVYHSLLDNWDGTTESSSWSGSGTKADPYLIQSGADLYHLKSEIDKKTANEQVYLGKYFKQTKSIDLSNFSGNFIIGKVATDPTIYFGGNYDGNNCSIRNFKITSGAQCSALFAKIAGTGSGLSNLSIYGSVSGGNFSAGLIGRGRSPISNLTNYCTVNESGANAAGGVIAENGGNATNCVNYGNISIDSSHQKIGGVMGIILTNKNTCTNCENYGLISNLKNNYVGGICGFLDATSSSNISYNFVNCINAGEVTGNQRLGGIVGGYTNGATLLNADGCVNYANIIPVTRTSGDYGAGGIAGKVAVGVVQNCVNYGNITSLINTEGANDTNIGGIIGYACNENSEVTSKGYKPGDGHGIFDCVNYGTMTGSQRVGGIIASCSVDIKRCTNNGKVTVDYNKHTKVAWAGGISSGTMMTGVTFEDCVNNGEVYMKTKSVSQYVGGIIGHSGGGFNFTAINCINNGNVYGNYCVGGIMGTTGSAGTTASQLAVKLLISGCTNNGAINGANPVGGIIGFLNNSKGEECLVNCANTGEITGRDKDADVGPMYGRIRTSA